jgi:hypothetical protein
MSQFVIRSSTGLALHNREGLDGLSVDDQYPFEDFHFHWELVPYFDDTLNYAGYGLRSRLDGRFIRACRDMPNGGGVTLVNADQVDDWAMWEVLRMGWNDDNRVIIIASNTYYSNDQRDLTLYGAGDWKAGTQVITYQWVAGKNQMWTLEPATV